MRIFLLLKRKKKSQSQKAIFYPVTWGAAEQSQCPFTKFTNSVLFLWHVFKETRCL